MDRGKIINVLGLVPGGDLSIRAMELVQWGRDIVFDCHYQTFANEQPDAAVMFRLIFRDCREARTRVYAHIGENQGESMDGDARVVELSLGQGRHRRDANMLTTFFSITISYDTVVVEYEGTERPLNP